jgi:Amt family ammonium transporter
VLVLLMTIPGLMLFYSAMLRLKNGLSVVAHLLLASSVVTLAWIALGYSVAFTPGNGWFGGMGRVMGEGLRGPPPGVATRMP